MERFQKIAIVIGIAAIVLFLFGAGEFPGCSTGPHAAASHSRIFRNPFRGIGSTNSAVRLHRPARRPSKRIIRTHRKRAHR